MINYTYMITDEAISMVRLSPLEAISIDTSILSDTDREELVDLIRDGDLDTAFQRLYDLRNRYERDIEQVLDIDDLPVDKELVELIEDRMPGWREFLERLKENPSRKVIEHLFRFLRACDRVTVDTDGMIYAYKGVRGDYKDVHSGRFDNRPGTTHSMPRNHVEDDPAVACAAGFHVGSYSYASNWGERVVLVKVDPADVVSVPYDHGSQKMRVCKYEVIEEVHSDDE
jgi:hypothetical protein